MHLASSCWVLMTDLDYGVPHALAEAALLPVRQPGTSWLQVHKFHRVDKRHRPTIHPAVALIHKNLFWEAGGCDEDFVGHYGQTDPHMWYRLDKHRPKAFTSVNKSWPPLKYVPPNENNTIERTHRDVRRNAHLFASKMAGRVPWSNDYLRFRWTSVMAGADAAGDGPRFPPRKT